MIIMTIMIIIIIMIIMFIIMIIIMITIMFRPSKYCGSPHQPLVQRRDPGRAFISFLNHYHHHDNHQHDNHQHDHHQHDHHLNHHHHGRDRSAIIVISKILSHRAHLRQIQAFLQKQK